MATKIITTTDCTICFIIIKRLNTSFIHSPESGNHCGEHCLAGIPNDLREIDKIHREQATVRFKQISRITHFLIQISSLQEEFPQQSVFSETTNFLVGFLQSAADEISQVLQNGGHDMNTKLTEIPWQEHGILCFPSAFPCNTFCSSVHSWRSGSSMNIFRARFSKIVVKLFSVSIVSDFCSIQRKTIP